MENSFDIRDRVLYKYKGTDKHVVIPDSVVTIYDKAFRFCNTVESIEVPDSVTMIMWGAFSFCDNLERLVIPASVNFISVSAIQGSTKLKTIVLNDSEYYYVKDNKIYSKGKDPVVISTEIAPPQG